MPAELLIDAQLPPALVRALAAAGHGARHVVDIGGTAMSDQDIWALACRQGWIIVTKDADFQGLLAAGGVTTGVVWIRMGNCRTSELLERLVPRMPAILDLLESGQQLVEVR